LFHRGRRIKGTRKGWWGMEAKWGCLRRKAKVERRARE